jgi:hypothetical protein
MLESALLIDESQPLRDTIMRTVHSRVLLDEGKYYISAEKGTAYEPAEEYQGKKTHRIARSKRFRFSLS